jgi:hypothetical protein
MTVQLLITMRRDFARLFARDRSLLDVASITDAASSARLISAPGFSMRIAVDESEVVDVRRALGSNFVLEPDYVMETFSDPGKRGGIRSVGQRQNHR